MNRIPYLAHAVKLALLREAQALQIFKEAQAAWMAAGYPEDLNQIRHKAHARAERAQEARALAETALIEAQVESMTDAERGDHYQALAEIRVGC